MSNMIISTIDNIQKIPKQDLLRPDGFIRLLQAHEFDAMDRNYVRWWCHQNARYGLPTKELVWWLHTYFVLGNNAIEIGSGCGDLGYHLNIKCTDSKMQEDPEIKAYYEMVGQPVIKYPERVEKLDALAAIAKYKPNVVIASWVTHWIDPKLPPPPGGGNVYGIKEDEILDTGATYVVVGNRKIHGYKPILKRPHLEVRLPFIRSRATYPEEDTVYVWEGKDRSPEDYRWDLE